jgi:hypothetical protein
VVAEYAAAMADGAESPPAVVFHDGASYWLADGFHRTHAARRATIKTIQAEIHNGTKRDAILYSVGANSAHGLRRDNRDKRKAVMTLLQDEEWSQWSNREIARHCAVDHTTVGRLRKSLVENTSEKPGRTYNTKHGTKSTMNTENIGKGGNPNKQSTSDRARQIQYYASEGYGPASSRYLAVPCLQLKS